MDHHVVFNKIKLVIFILEILTKVCEKFGPPCNLPTVGKAIFSFAMGLTDEMGFGTQVWHAKILELAIAQWIKNTASLSI